MRENNGLIYYPPNDHGLRALFAKYIILAIFLFVFAYIYRQWGRGVLPDWVTLVLVFFVLFGVLWIYRIEKIWIFMWGQEQVVVSLKQNMLMYAWLTIRINGALALSQATRVRGSIIEVKDTLHYANRPVPFAVTIRKTAEAHLLECALKVEGSSLTTR